MADVRLVGSVGVGVCVGGGDSHRRALRQHGRKCAESSSSATTAR
jgi:hypothetical protein